MQTRVLVAYASRYGSTQESGLSRRKDKKEEN